METQEKDEHLGEVNLPQWRESKLTDFIATKQRCFVSLYFTSCFISCIHFVWLHGV